MREIITLFFVIVAGVLCGQTNDRFNNDVLVQQGNTTNKTMIYLEYGNILWALENFSKDLDAKLILEQISEELEKIRKNAKMGYVIVFDDGHNIFRCRYTNEALYYQVDLHYAQGDPNSKIIKVEVKDKATLDKEAKERNESDEIPPPPPAQE